MIITHSSRFNFDLFVRCTSKFLWGVASLVLLLFLGFYFQESENGEVNFLPQKACNGSAIDYEAIGLGPLALHASGCADPLFLLSHEIYLFAHNTRPALDPGELSLELTLKASQEKKNIGVGERVYLQGLVDGNSSLPLCFADEKSSLWLELEEVTPGSALIAVNLLDASATLKSVHLELDVGAHDNAQLSGHSSAQSLQSAKWWGVDHLYQKYGGLEYAAMQNREKLELSGLEPYFIFVKGGDYLTWEGDRWRVTSLLAARRDMPLAKVESIESSQMQLSLWDSSGAKPLQVNLRAMRGAPLANKVELLPSSFKMRSLSQITCMFGKRRVILQEGDWLLKTEKGWRVLNQTSDIENCLSHKIQGDLFIFDKIEKDHEVFFLKGNLFNDMRDQSCLLAIPLSRESKKNSPRSKKKHVFSKRNFVSSPTCLKQL